MRVAFVVQGVVSAAVDEMAAALVRARHDVHVYADQPFDLAIRRPDGVQRTVIDTATALPDRAALRQFGHEVGWHLERQPPDLVHAFGVLGGVAAHVAAGGRVPVVQTVGHLALTERRLGAPASRRLAERMVLEQRLLSRAAMIVAIAPDQAIEILRSGQAPERIITIAPGIDPQRYPVTPLPRRGAQRPWRLLHVGGTRLDSGLPEVLGAISRLPNVHLTVLGADPDHTEEVAAMARRWHAASRLHLHPRVPRSAMAGMYVAADAVVAASRQLASGRSALEAISSGRPPIVTACGGLLDCVEDEVSGFVAAPRDASSLSEAIKRAMSASRTALEDMVQAGSARLRAEHTWQQRMPFILGVYEATLARHGQPIAATDVSLLPA